MGQAMIPTVRDLSPESRDLLKRQLAALFPASGIAGLYSRKIRIHSRYWRLEIHCGATRQIAAVADFPGDGLLEEALPWLCMEMQKQRAE